jgi:hypothetical protein
MTTAERIAACAYRHWMRAKMTEWPTVRQVCKRLGLRHVDIEECDGDGPYLTETWDVRPTEPYGQHFVVAMTDEVDRAWDEYWKPYNRVWGVECAS